MADQFTEIITEEKAIINTLRPLIDARIVFKMDIPRTKHSWITVLLGIEEMGGSRYLLIDKTAGFESTISHYPDGRVSLEFKEKGGVPCLFYTRIITCRPGDILAEIPEEITRVQRRQYFRLEAYLGTEITFRIGSSEEKERAKVKDFSAGGIAFFTEKGSKFNAGDLLNDIYLNVPEGDGFIHFHIPQAVVRRVEQGFFYGIQSQKPFCAIEFTEISVGTRDQLIAHISKQQRIVIRRVGR
jgi:hypothetical protein